jgi:hypothetical protein
MDITLVTGQMVHIPAYWWYSIRFVKSNTSICAFKYKTYMNTLAISNHLFMRLLQRQNTKRVIAKKMDLKMNKTESEIDPMLDNKEKKDHNNDVKIDIEDGLGAGAGAGAGAGIATGAAIVLNKDEVTRIDL